MKPAPGSSVLFILLLTMVIGMSFLNRIRSTSFMLDVARKREQFEKQYFATQGLLSIGIDYAIEEGIKEKKDSFVITIDQWPPDNNDYHGKVKITKKNTEFFIESFLMKNDLSICALSCIVKKHKDIIIASDKKESQLVISNFQHTFSAV